MPKPIALLVPIAISVLLLLSACGHRAEGSANAPPNAPPGQAWLTPAQVREGKIVVAPAGEHEVGGQITAAGRVTFDDLAVTHVFSPVSGRVVQVQAALGQQVKQGEALATVDSPDLGSAYSDLLKAQAEYASNEHAFKRKTELLALQAVSPADVERAEDEYRKSKAELERAKLKAQMIRMSNSNVESRGEQYVLRSPIDGKVVARAINPGLQIQGVLGGGTAMELFTIGALKRVWVMADIYEMDLAEVSKGATVIVDVISYPRRHFSGRVNWVSSTLDPQLRTARVRCVIDNTEELLKPEMYATVKITVPRQKALAVPRDAVLYLGDQTVVFVQLPDGPDGLARFERRPIKLADEAAGPFLAVEHGLDPGEPVVVEGAILISGAI